MAPASNTNNTNKCTRFDNSVLSKKHLPKALAISFIKSHIAMLQLDLATLLERFGTQRIKLLIKVYNKSKQLERLQINDELIPCSVCIKFTFHVSPAAEQSE
eukprot:5514726-Ditylum_brightwellii.AAC.1